MKKRKPRQPKKKKRRKESDGPVLMRHPFSGLDQTALRTAFARMAEQKAEDFPKLLATILDLARKKSPLHALSILSTYGLQTTASDEGVDRKSLTSDLQQFHIELFHALIMSVPIEEWGTEPSEPHEIQTLIDSLKGIGDAFHQRRLKIVKEDRDDQERTVISLQELLRMHTQAVRNWGYYGDVRTISGELYGGLDEEFRAALGFAPTELLAVAKQMVSTVEARSNERYRILRRIFREQKINKFVRAYYKQYPGIEGDPEEFIRSIPPGTPKEAVAARLMSHADLSLGQYYLIPVPEIAAELGLDEKVVRSILVALAMVPGDLKESDPEHFFLTNPVWQRPLIWLADEYFYPTPMSIFSHIHGIMRMLGERAGLSEAIERRRAIYLEWKVDRILKTALPGADARSAVKWSWGGVEYETDHLLVIDNIAIIVEDKSAALTAAGLRGAPDRVRRHVRDLILDPSEQSARLEGLIELATAKDGKAIEALKPFGLDLTKVERFVRISVTLEDFSTLSSMEGELKDAGWIPADIQLATTMNVADLKVVAEMLDNPCYLVDYLKERARIQKALNVVGDELDFLGFYLSTGFNIYSFEKEGAGLGITGMSQVVDVYCESRDAGIHLKKPVPRIRPYYASVVEAMNKRRFPAWLRSAIDLLRSASYDEQREVESKLAQLKAKVQKNWRDPAHECCLVLTPPEIRDTAILFYVFPTRLADKRKEIAEQLAGKALEENSMKRCIVIARCVERWDDPYAFIYIAKMPDT